MSDQSMMSRRDALIAATAIGVAGAVEAGDQKSSDGEFREKTAPLKLAVTLTDGQVVTLSAAELVITFAGEGKLLVKPNGVMPVTKVYLDTVGGGQKQGSDNPKKPGPATFDNDTFKSP